MNPTEVGSLLQKLYSDGHDRRVWLSAAPQQAVRELAERLNLKWTEDDIAVSASVLDHPANLRTIDLLEELRVAGGEMEDVRSLSAGASRQMMLMESGVAITGIGILVASLAASFRGDTVLAAILGGMSLASFLTLFVFDPLKQIQRSVSESVQLELIYQAYLTELRHWKAYEARADVVLQPAVLAEIRDATANALWLLERYVESRYDVAAPAPLGVAPPYAGATPLTARPAFIAKTLPMTDEMLPQVNPSMPPKILRDTTVPPVIAVPPTPPGKGVFFSEKMSMVEKSPISEKLYLDQAPHGAVDTPNPDGAATSQTLLSHQLPFSLVTQHHAPMWERHDPAALAEEQARIDRLIATLESSNVDDRKTLVTELMQQRDVIVHRLEQLKAEGS